MNPLLLIVTSIGWYFLCELLQTKFRRKANMPSPMSFWIGLLQSAGTFAWVVAAAVVYFTQR